MLLLSPVARDSLAAQECRISMLQLLGGRAGLEGNLRTSCLDATNQNISCAINISVDAESTRTTSEDLGPTKTVIDHSTTRACLARVGLVDDMNPYV